MSFKTIVSLVVVVLLSFLAFASFKLRGELLAQHHLMDTGNPDYRYQSDRILFVSVIGWLSVGLIVFIGWAWKQASSVTIIVALLCFFGSCDSKSSGKRQSGVWVEVIASGEKVLITCPTIYEVGDTLVITTQSTSNDWVLDTEWNFAAFSDNTYHYSEYTNRFYYQAIVLPRPSLSN